MDSNKKSKILVVDDDIELCNLLRQYLEKQGFTVDTVEDGKMMDIYLENSSAASHGERMRGLVVPRRRRAVVLSESELA